MEIEIKESGTNNIGINNDSQSKDNGSNQMVIIEKVITGLKNKNADLEKKNSELVKINEELIKKISKKSVSFDDKNEKQNNNEEDKKEIQNLKQLIVKLYTEIKENTYKIKELTTKNDELTNTSNSNKDLQKQLKILEKDNQELKDKLAISTSNVMINQDNSDINTTEINNDNETEYLLKPNQPPIKFKGLKEMLANIKEEAKKATNNIKDKNELETLKNKISLNNYEPSKQGNKSIPNKSTIKPQNKPTTKRITRMFFK